ncbi:hypothetical protein [uncultured Brevundimonas sp.]|uniref:hypothetical protein n=1 Tax=uncultured Brevundimonas sp. TaxID=213418 RepID=UPI0030ECE242|tara:strand:- start:818 stop:1123 length:306 start_codon:yes stop_codon:yes gene_type:complete
MTNDVENAKPGLLKKGRGFLWTLAAFLGVAAVCGWVALGIGLWMDVERTTRLVLAIVAAVATEALFWTVAAALGVSVVEARKRIWRRITGRGAESAPTAAE